MTTTDEPKACSDCGYGTCHCDDLAKDTDGMPADREAFLEDQLDAAREVLVTDAGPPAPDAALGLRWHGPPAPLIAALARAKAKEEFPDELDRDGHTDYTLDSGRQVEYWYTTLKTLCKDLDKPLAEEGLVVIQPPSEGPGGDRVVRTILAHESGSMVESTLSIGQHAKPQDMASAITYARRYAKAGILGISAETDDDGAAANEATPDAGGHASPKGGGQPARGGGGHNHDPATDKQKSYIRQLAKEATEAGATVDDLPGLDEVTKSEASDMIDTLKKRKQDAQFTKASKRQAAKGEGQANLDGNGGGDDGDE